MLKKLLILALILLIAGVAVISYLHNETSKQRREIAAYRAKHGAEAEICLEQYKKWLISDPEQRGELPFDLSNSPLAETPGLMRQQQRQRLLADQDHLSLETVPADYADILYGKGWRQYLRQYRKREADRELAMTVSIVAASIGALISAWCVLVAMVRVLLWSSSSLGGRFRRKNQAADCPTEQGLQDCTSDAPDEPGADEQAHKPVRPRKHSKVLENSGWHGLWNGKKAEPKQKPQQPAITSETRLEGVMTDAERIGRAFSKRTFHPTRSLQTPPPRSSAPLSSQPHLAVPDSDIAPADDPADAQSMENIEAKTVDLENQLAEFKEMAQTIQQSTKEYSAPLDTLNELSQQVSAIREYVAGQQDRVERLQDGYDWTIVRTFCLRIIRCIDNLETRIDDLQSRDVDTSHLMEVRDELLFALESSGIEQFSPETNTEYRGCEKFAEAVKEREETDDPQTKGKIAQIVRPGYRYFIDEDNSRIVRSAQVKIFG